VRSTTVRLPDLLPAPAHIVGPTWQRRADTGAFYLPEHSLGWGIINWLAAFVAMPGDPVQHAVALIDLGQDSLAEETGHARDRHDLGRDHQCPAQVGDRLTRAGFHLPAVVGILRPLADALGVLLGDRRV
jgi:hypothetical protein